MARITLKDIIHMQYLIFISFQPFADITTLTDIQEGIIVRCIQRLHETTRDVRNAARIIGDPILYQKMEEASHMIKRDIVFAASLYTQWQIKISYITKIKFILIHIFIPIFASQAKVPIRFPPLPLGGFRQVFKLSANMRLTSLASYMLVVGSLVMY